MLLMLSACSAADKEDDDDSSEELDPLLEPEESGPPSEVEWGSWELETTFLQQSAICSDMTANGQDELLYAEVNVEEPDTISMLLGTRTLIGVRTASGFLLEGFDAIDTGADDPMEHGLGSMIDATVEDEKSFSGVLVYTLDFPQGFCEIESSIEAIWMYYEPPPDCGG